MSKIKEYLKAFIYAKGRPAPVYFWATLFCSLAVAMLIMRFLGRAELSDALILGVLGFVATWIALYNFRRNDNNGGGTNGPV